MAQFTDQEIIDTLLKREKRSTNAVMEQLYRQNKKVISQLVYTGGGNEMDAEDLFQELMSIFLNNVWHGQFVLRDNTRISTYLYATARNRWFKKSKSKSAGYERSFKFLKSQEDEVPDDPDALSQLIEKEEDAGSLALFLKLDEQDQAILRAFAQEKLTMEEIAEKFELTNASAAKTRKYRAMEKLRKLIGVFKTIGPNEKTR